MTRFPIMKNLRHAVLFLLVALPGAAGAQGVFEMGALGGQPQTGAPKTPATRLPDSALHYTPSLAVRKHNYEQFVEKTRASDPAGADQLQKLFASQDVIDQIGKGVAAYGMHVDDLADAFTLYWVNAWCASRGLQETGTKEQAAGVRRQAANAMLSSPQLGTLNDAQKQELAESLLIQGMMLDAAVNAAKSDPAKLDHVKAGARRGAKAMGLDLDLVELTPTGFVRAGGAKPAR